jgi:hypothetical protein
MASSVLEAIQQDRLALSVGGALALANETAVAEGVDPAASLVTITQETTPDGRCWNVHYGPVDFVQQRGGDLTIVVNESGEAVTQILHGQ